ncbi:hypothetical protein [Dactylosporangium sp. NPDC050588]|uniref:hypothetical protein n=1 Tax=Dactylosporangium sp. NPDC050588 TaxID=3157211 RepID=UPI0033D279C0
MTKPDLADVKRPKSRTVSRFLAGGAVALAATLGAVFVAPAAAMAAPTSCQTWDFPGYEGYAIIHCYGGSGYYRVRVMCAYQPTDNLKYLYYGDWVYAPDSGNSSAAYCQDNQYFLSSIMMTA